MIINVPESITRAQYVSLVTGAGLDPEALRRLEFRIDGIYAEVTVEPRRLDEVTDEVVVHRVFIPVVDG